MSKPDRIYRGLREKGAGRGRDRYRHLYAALAAQLTERRSECGLSQTELAARCGTTQSAIARLESGQRPPRVDTLLGVAEALDCDVEVRLVPRTGAS